MRSMRTAFLDEKQTRYSKSRRVRKLLKNRRYDIPNEMQNERLDSRYLILLRYVIYVRRTCFLLSRWTHLAVPVEGSIFSPV